jgi:hypothetical protein
MKPKLPKPVIELRVAEMCSKDGIHKDVCFDTVDFIALVKDFFTVLMYVK